VKKFKLTDFELVKQDLYNHFNIRKGEKLMDPSFGTIIWGLLFEPLTDELKNAVSKDIKTIISYDPRLAVNTVTITQYDYGLQIELELTYIPTNQVQMMSVKFDQESQTATVR
jgi:phage baseplate assembly protein W